MNNKCVDQSAHSRNLDIDCVVLQIDTLCFHGCILTFKSSINSWLLINPENSFQSDNVQFIFIAQLS